MGPNRTKHSVRLTGGLGNQLFQASHALALRQRTGETVSLDLDWFDGGDGPDQPLSPFQRYRLPELGFDSLPTESSKGRSRQSIIRKVTNRANLQLDAKFGRSVGSLVHRGYWQSERHFEDVVEVVAAAFQLPTLTSASGQDVEADIQSVERSVSIHVRRGDYLHFDGLPVCSSAYYRAALSIVGSYTKVFVFSDDIEYCKAEFADLEEVTFVDNTESDLEDMALMSMCDAHVIANSTFSWWAAWFGEQASPTERVVVAPAPWFNIEAMDHVLSRHLEPDHIVPDRWRVLLDPDVSQRAPT